MIAALGLRDVISLIPPKAFLPVKAAIAAENKLRQRTQVKAASIQSHSPD